MPLKTPKYTSLRNKTYWLHLKLPGALFKQTDLNSQLVRCTLNTQDPSKAGSLAQILVFKLQEYFKSVAALDISKSSIDQVIETTLVSLGEVKTMSVAKVQRPTTRDLSLSAAFELYFNEMTSAGMWRVKTQCDCRAALNNFVELMGDIGLSSINAAVCREFKSKLMRYPLNKAKSTELMNQCVNKLIESGSVYPIISTTTVNNQIRKINSFFNWLIKQGLLQSNPIAGMKIKQKVSLKAARASFTETDLTALFSTPLYSKHEFLHDYQFWLPLLALYSGARIEELCQLHIADININDPFPHYRISDLFEGQHIKNNSSRRVVPIHPELMELGFANLISDKKAKGQTKLFGYLVPQRQQLGHKPSQWFSRYKRKQGINDPRKVFHSFRHTMVDRMKQIRAQDYEIKSLLGHQHGSVTHDIYGSIDTPIDSVYETVSKLTFKSELALVKPWE